MSTKPTIALARFADLVGSTVVDPPSALRDTGFQDATPAAVDFVNALFKQNYLWSKWLDDGDCAFHNLSATGTLGATGATTLGAKLTVSTGGADINGAVHVIGGTLTTDASQAVALGGNTSVGGTLGVTGLTTANGGVQVNGALGVTGAVGITGALSVGGAITCTASEFLPIGPAAAAIGTNIVYSPSTDRLLKINDTAPIDLAYAIKLWRGRKIVGVRVHVQHTSATAGLWTAVLQRSDMSNNVTTRSSVGSSTASASKQVIVLTGITPTAIGADESWSVYVASPGGPLCDRYSFGVEIEHHH